VLTAALQPAAGTDSASNAFGAGYTGPVQAIQPASSPSVVEGWHNVTPPSGWSGINRYKLLAELNMAVIEIHCSSAATSGNVTFMTLPAAYIPSPYGSVIRRFPIAMKSNTAPTNSNATIDVNSNGQVTTFGLYASTTEVHALIYYPLN
jgi:hypothetical protein